MNHCVAILCNVCRARSTRRAGSGAAGAMDLVSLVFLLLLLYVLSAGLGLLLSCFDLEEAAFVIP